MTDPEATARMIALEATVTELRAQLATLVERTTGRFGSMRDTSRCPACGHGRLLHIRTVTESASKGLDAMGLFHTQSRWTGMSTAFAPLSAFACRACGLVEWHAIDFEGITPDGDIIVEIEPGPERSPPRGGPYR